MGIDGTQIWLIGVLTVAVVTYIGQVTVAIIRREKPSTDNGYLAKHIVTCPNKEALEQEIEQAQKAFTREVSALRQEMAEIRKTLESILLHMKKD